MHKRILTSGICVLLSLLMILSSCYICLGLIGVEKAANVRLDTVDKKPSTVTPLLPLGGTTSSGFDIAPTQDESSSSYGSVEAVIEDGHVVGYRTAEYTFSFDVSVSTSMVDTVFCNGKNVAGKYYEGGDMYPDIILLGNNTVSVIYGDSGLPETLIVNDGYYSADYTADGKLLNTYFGGQLERAYEYNEGGYILQEKNSDGTGPKYEYVSNQPQLGLSNSGSGDLVEVRGNRIVYAQGGDTYTYIFDYEYNGERYLTSIEKNGVLKVSYSYLNGVMAAVQPAGDSEIVYMLDPDLNQIGMICNGRRYYFIYDTVGNLYCILDEDGAAISFYEVSAYGMPVVTSVLDDKNVMLNTRAVFDKESGAIIKPFEVFLTQCHTVASLSGAPRSITAQESLLFGCDGLYGKRDALPFGVAIRAKVIEEAMYYLESQGYATASNVSIVDADGEHVDYADLYVLNSICASQSIKNAFAGDRIYTLVRAGEDREAATSRIAAYAGEENTYFVEYFENYEPVVGDIVFEGQFIYFGYLISYHASNDGVITYKVIENERENYNDYNNIFNYDTNSYAVFSDDTFELSDWDYTKLIPGLNQEQYDVVETYISEALQICSNTSFGEIGYYDQSYYDSYVHSAMGDTLEPYVDLDPGAMVVLSQDGGITVTAIPFWEQTAVRKQICRTVGKAVLATVVAGVISVAVPGSGVVVFAVLKGAVIQGLKASLGSFVIAVGVDLAKEHLLGQELNETIDERLLRYATIALDAYSVGVIGGAIAGNLRYRKFFKATGDTLSSNVSSSQRMQMKLDALDSKYSGGLLDDSMAARSEYESMRLTIQSVDYSSRSIAQNVIVSSRNRSSWLKKAMKVFTKAMPWEKLVGKEG